jgi:flagellar biosynthetic protein FliQ
MNNIDLQIVDLARDLLITTIIVAGPVLIVGLVVGIGVSLFQALTSVQEQTMSLVPKMLAVMLVTLLLLAPARMKEEDHSKPAFGLVRSVNGARVVPAEGAAPLLEAVTEFVDLQYANNDDMTWDRLSKMLESTNPFMLETALDQHLKFRRGTTRDLASLRPLIAHPSPETRMRALSISAIIIERTADEPLPDADLIRTEFSGRARRDDDPRVRSAAVDALAQLDLSGIDLLLEEIARDDPDQGVRYSAERRLLEREERRRASAEAGGSAH